MCLNEYCINCGSFISTHICSNPKRMDHLQLVIKKSLCIICKNKNNKNDKYDINNSQSTKWYI